MTKNQIRAKRNRGQGMTEYIIIVALIAIAAIATVTLFGNNIRGLFGTAANVLNGTETKSTLIKDSTTTDQDRNFDNWYDATNT